MTSTALTRHRVDTSLGKRALDLAITLPLLVLLSPLLLAIAVAVKLTSRGPVLFRQTRVGFREQPFAMVKFRSMVVSAPSDDRALREAIREELAGVRRPENDSFKLAADPRVTRVGRVLRATSLDEITQLFNVARGEMSLVGPRPALDWEHDAFPPEFRRRTDALPGISGLWQVSGRSQLSTPEMLRLDIEYVDRRSLWLDIQILFRTIPVVIRGDGAR
jgi:lipopolysaccharide/colanic/teichoic acid biosynthesis glycosyltransferase